MPSRQTIRSISVIIPCLNEEENLRATYENVIAALKDRAEEFEILIFDDGSSDKTGEIADAIQKSDPSVAVWHNRPNKGFGYNFTKGITIARMNYVAVIPGDNEISGESIGRIFALMGKADMIIPFTVNMEVRPWGRRLISRLFTVLMNAMFQCELQYYNGPTLHRTDLVRDLDVRTSGFAFQAVMLVKLIRRGYSFCEVDMYLRRKPVYRSNAVRLQNISSVISAILRLVIDVVRDPTLRNRKELGRVNPHAN
jgi:glycosyltransferase involved in cell wall biosynthesis